MRTKKRQSEVPYYRPAAIMVVDLVGHSKRDKPSIQAIQSAMQEAFARAKEQLGISEASFKYTGDGYVCTLAGDASALIVDFINSAIPRLQGFLQGYGQEFRIGVDFGMVHFDRNTLTGKQEHFDSPGIMAARLESAASPGEILCTEIVYKLFSSHYPGMFKTAPKILQTKDRELVAYTVLPVDDQDFQRLLSNYLFKQTATTPNHDTSKGLKVLIADDESTLIEATILFLENAFPSIEVIAAESGDEALSSYKLGTYSIVITDLMMPGMNGLDLIRKILAINPDQRIIMMTGYPSDESRRAVLGAGALYYLIKPFRFEELLYVFRVAMSCRSPRTFHSRLKLLCNDPGMFLGLLHEISGRLSSVAQLASTSDLAASLLRHKAKLIVREITDAFQPGAQVVGLLTVADVQLRCIERLARFVNRATIAAGLDECLKQFCEDIEKTSRGIKIEYSCVVPRNIINNISFGTTLILLITELVDNAVSATNEKGTIYIRISYLTSSNMLHLEVADTGPGIPRSVAASVFEAGTSTKGTGRGLGLSLVKGAVEALKGDISLAEGPGAIFRVRIPFS